MDKGNQNVDVPFKILTDCGGIILKGQPCVLKETVLWILSCTCVKCPVVSLLRMGTATCVEEAMDKDIETLRFQQAGVEGGSIAQGQGFISRSEDPS